MNQLTQRLVSCPYCGESIDVLIDVVDLGSQYIEDCQVCCRPITFSIFEDGNEHLCVNVFSEDDVF